MTRNLRILGTGYRAADIADTSSICSWNPDMYGVDMRKPGAQAWYDSIFRLYASWGVDFVKMDDMSRPCDAHAPEIEAAHKAIAASGRPMILSLSPGETPLVRADHVRRHAQMWRISDDFWDEWPLLEAQFTRLENWNPPPRARRVAGRGHAAARPSRARQARLEIHPRRAAHPDDPVVDRALAAHHGRRSAAPRCCHAGAC